MDTPHTMRTRIGDYLADFAEVASTAPVTAMLALGAVALFHQLGYRDSAVAASGAFLAYLQVSLRGRAADKPPEEPKP